MTVSLVRLFSLDLLKAFVAAGRRLSITQAAEELCLTQSAVSRQIQALEDQVGVKLFRRLQRGVAFTAEGERLFRAADHAIRQLQEVAQQIRPTGRPRAVTITASTGVMSLWLLPRLPALQERLPGIDVRLSATNLVSDLRADGIDLAMRYARDAAVPAGAIRLFDESLAPLAHPRVREALRRGEPVPLLEFDDSRAWLQWRRWLEGTPGASARRQVIHFNQYEQVIQAALAGQGLAIGRIELLQPLLDSGQLVVVEELPCTPVPSPNAIWLICAEEEPGEEVRQVAEWIRLEAARVRSWKHPAPAAAAAAVSTR